MTSSPVSRETPEPPVPRETAAWLATLTPASRDQLTAYARLLRTDGIRHGLLGPREAERIWDRHLSNCAPITSLIPEAAAVVDVGAGAGLPGVVVAILRPDVSVTLVEPQLRRTEFLSAAVADLGLNNAAVERGRAEAVPGGRFDVVTSRALAPVDRLLSWCLPLCREGGQVLAIKGAGAADEVRKFEAEIGRLRVRDLEVVQLESFVGDTPTTVLRCTGPVGDEGSAR